jgi:hypothetical protein
MNRILAATADFLFRFGALALLAFCGYQCVRIGYANFLFRKGDPQSVEAAIRVLPEESEYHRRLAALLSVDASQQDRAEQELQIAAKLNPRDAGSLLELAVHAESRGDASNAERFLILAEKVDKQYAPAWALANFYFRRQNWPSFWEWARISNSRAFDNRWPLFRLAVASNRSPVEVLDWFGERRPKAVHEFLDFLISADNLEKTDPIAERLIEFRRHEDAQLIKVYCDRLILHGNYLRARAVWNRATVYGLIHGDQLGLPGRPSFANGSFEDPIDGQGFGWRLSLIPGVQVHQGNGLNVELDGTQPEAFDLIAQFVPVEQGKQYRVVTARADGPEEVRSGWQWRIEDAGVSQAQNPAPGIGPVLVLVRVVYGYRRISGTVRPSGAFTIGRATLEIVN